MHDPGSSEERYWNELHERWTAVAREQFASAGGLPGSAGPGSLAEPAHDAGSWPAASDRKAGSGAAEARRRFLHAWRCPEEPAQAGRSGIPLDPASQRSWGPVWAQADAQARLHAVGGEAQAAFLSFSLGPVQTFIATARSVRDLWTGSYLMAYLAFQAMKPVLDRYGPTAFVFPALRGIPLVDEWLRRERGLSSLPAPTTGEAIDRLLTPCLPNRFLAVVRAGDEGTGLARACEDACGRAWRQLASRVRDAIGSNLPAGWDRLWDAQIASFFEIQALVVPWSELHSDRLDRLQVPAGPDYSRRLSVTFGSLDAARSARHVPAYEGQPDDSGQVPAKCSLMGSYEQMGPALLRESKDFWETASQQLELKGTRLRQREHFCAIALVKRFAWAGWLWSDLGLDAARDRRFDDTATIAARLWLAANPPVDPDEIRHRHKTWNGQWLHWSGPHDDRDEDRMPDELFKIIPTKRKAAGPAPAYYAILALDGDRMGQRLRALNSDAHHAAFSAALANFALWAVPDIIERHHGELIYSGGDDVLAFLPTATSLNGAWQLRQAFGSDGAGLGRGATVSAGLVVVHYKEDLRFALEQARDAEKLAKNQGRDALGLTIVRRSGERTRVLVPWTLVGPLIRLVERFALAQTTDRWAYKLRELLPTLRGLDESAAVQAIVRHAIQRVEQEDDRKFLESWANEVFEPLLDALETRGVGRPDAVESFVTLCQSASFLARGRDAQ
jgi:CRISPR-associated protein Cmr2